MTEFLTALALVFFIEGCFYALMPERMQQMMRMALEMDAGTLRRAGLIAMIAGLALAWLVRGG
ncbi:DUF2065 domain-containing protein [Nisaea acidiphila]|uniref:DUF2065 domain-containing protein n=1 Tax=Nisaea acidiphila TaxID=1862145 RepID=A0A9J7AQ06_9PROT|nr:DUF2065 domain-containing protein [Nisaea acidiphila]UUX49480.1 DUF2065 domain-containing protein [Nisaea acidiphila]